MGEQKGPEYYDDLWPRLVKTIKDDSPWQSLWEAIADEIQRKRVQCVIDVGCGCGHLAKILYDRREAGKACVMEYIGVDFSEFAIEHCQSLDLPDEFQFKVWDVLERGLPLPDFHTGPTTGYVFCEMLEHVDDDLNLMEAVPQSASVMLTVPTFGDPAHVRQFDGAEAVAQRYESFFLNTWKVRPLPPKHFMMTGLRDESSPNKRTPVKVIEPSGITTVVVAWDEERGVSNLMCSVGGNVLYLVDSKTRDNTAEIAKGQGAKVVDFDWEDDFSYARNLAHQHVDTPWILVLDGHESVEGYDLLSEAILDFPDAAVFEVEVVMENGESHMRDRLYHKDRCEWRNRAHNVLHVKEGGRVHVDGVRVVHDRYSYQALDSRTHRSTQRDAMLCKVLTEEIDKNPLDTRSMFYLGQQHRDAGRWVPCYYWYDRYTRTENGNQWPEEEFQAHYQAGLAALCLRDLGGVKRHALAATELLGATRAEGWVLIGAVHYTKKEYVAALKAYQEASLVEVPTDAKLWVDRTLHAGGWMITDKICMCHWHLGNHEKAIGIYKALLSKGEFPGGEREHLEKNLEWHEGRLNRT